MDSADFGARLPSLSVPPPGPASRELAARLRRVESRNVTFLAEDFPVFWDEAVGANVRDADGNVYVDVTSAFGPALPGHAHPRVVDAVRRQAGRLMHGMGDVHPPALKVELLERLGARAPWPNARCVLASTGSEAVEIALKTALLATGRPGILAFEGGYHGLTMGALAATARPYFREPFEARLYPGVIRTPFPDPLENGGISAADSLSAVEFALANPANRIGAVLLEPVQGRGGIRIPPSGFLERVTALARRHGALVVADEVFTGVGRSGRFLASDRLHLAADIICLGKALGGGMPISACLAPDRVMDAWPVSPGEALHTSTFLGHPVACAAALAVLDLVDEGLPARAEAVGLRLLEGLRERLPDMRDGAGGVGGSEVRGVADVRGLGAMIGVELVRTGPDGVRRPADGAAPELAVHLLKKGVLVLPAGDRGHVLELAPPACLTEEQSDFVVERVAEVVDAWSG